MDKSSEMIENFEKVLRNQNTRKPIFLYSDKRHQNIEKKQTTTYCANDIISNVSQQLKAFQNADCVKINKRSIITLNKYKKSSFLPVNMISEHGEVPQHKATTSKFETQIVSDTQLIDIIEDAEALVNANRGMTQEFNTTFCHSHIENYKDDTRNEKQGPSQNEENMTPNGKVKTHDNDAFGIIDISLKEPDLSQNFPHLSRVIEQNLNSLNIKQCDPHILNGNVIDPDNCSQTINRHIDAEENKDQPDLISEDTDIPLSLILNVKSEPKKSKLPSPLVFNLASFEKFEKIASPLVEASLDIETTKHLINSQIMGKELTISIDTEPVLGEIIPELKFDNDENEVHNTKSDTSEEPLRELGSSGIDSNKNNKIVFVDEILFSSDEDENYVHKDWQELPFTCVLETSFYDQSDVLDKTMYVAFQTASDKSIQIDTDSFTKAKSFFDDLDEEKSVKGPLLSELVERCDGSNSIGYLDPDNNYIKGLTTTDIVESVKEDLTNCVFGAIERRSNIKKKTNINADNNNLVGFKTANDLVSEEAMIKSQTLLNDISMVLPSISNDVVNVPFPFKIPTKSICNFEGFKTASNNKIKLSKRALVRSKKVFKDIDLCERDNVLFDMPTDKVNKSCISDAETYENSLNVLDNNKGDVPETYKQANIDDEHILQEFDIEMNQTQLTDDNMVFTKGICDFASFKTASNKNIQISNVALENTQHIFQDIDEEIFDTHKDSANNNDKFTQIEDGNECTMQNIVGFKTASNKNIKISKLAFAKTKNIFRDIDTDKEGNSLRNLSTENTDKLCIGSSFKDFNLPSTSKQYFGGFKTANNKEIKVSEDALLKTKYVFQAIEKEDYERQERKETIFNGFETASHKDVTLSTGVLVESKIPCKDIENDKFEVFTYVGEEEPAFQGFQTADNSKNDELSKNKQILKNLLCADQIEEDLGDSTNINQSSIVLPIKRSAETLVRCKNLCLGISIIDEEVKNKQTTNLIDINIPKFQGFQTASNKTVNISAEALAKSKKIFQEDERDCNYTKDEATVLAFRGFQTASNKRIDISEEALAKSRKLIQEVNENDTDFTKDKVTVSQFQGFQTASNKKVKISEEALVKSRKLFEVEYEETSTNIAQKSTTSFKGFQTASKKEVNIPEHVLTKSKQCFKEIDCETDIFNIDKPKDGNQDETNRKLPYVFGFKTANNNNIIVSEEALKKSRKLFTEIDNKQDEELLKAIVEAKDDNKSSYNNLNIENIINTQVLHNFEETLNTEDFLKVRTPERSKRSGSPILSCPRAKKRKKFETPYSQRHIEDQIVELPITKQSCIKKPTYIFDNDYKKSKIYTLKALHEMEKKHPNTETEIDPFILNFNFENLLEFEFFGKRNDIAGDRWNKDDIKNYFLVSVNKKLVPEGWVEINLKLILWKLISYEIKFPNSVGIVCTSKNVVEQLKYRYDRELYNAERPALRKILEKDDTSMKTIVLCVAAIYSDGINVNSATNSSNIELLLTDGWYCIKASVDKMLSKLVCDGKIFVGTKIVTHGAELVNCEQGVSPWEDTSEIRLKLSGNSTRRARWDARLGYHGNAAILTRLSSVDRDGGRVSRLRAFVARVYPALYVEKLVDGSTVTRSERLEHILEMKYESERQALMEKIYEEVEKEFVDQDSQDSECSIEADNKRKHLDSGSQIAKVMKTSRDPVEFRNQLTDSQRHGLHEYSSRQRERLLRDIETKVKEKMERLGLNLVRSVVPLVKVRIASVEETRAGVEITKAMMSIWKPNEVLMEIIKEGAWIEIMNVVPTSIRYSEIQLSAGRQSLFSQSKFKETEKFKPFIKTLKRTYYTIKDLAQNPAMTTDYNEIDTVGLIFLIDPSIKDFDSNKQQFQNVYLTDADKNIICVNFWGGLKKFGYENVLDAGQIVACTNLQKRAGSTRKNVPQYRATEFSYFTKTPKNEDARKMVGELTKNFFGVDKLKFYEDCVNLKNNHLLKLQSNNENISPYRFRNIDINMSKNKIFLDSPLAKLSNIDENLNLTGLDFESTFKQTDTQEFSPKALLRKKQVKEKIAKLKMYGEPPPLSPIQIMNKSINAGKAFKSPLIPKSDFSSVASENKSLQNERKNAGDNGDTETSPVLMNRTYVKRTNLNPVKLNFSNSIAIDENNVSDVIDHFSGDFDGSPPLSLD